MEVTLDRMATELLIHTGCSMAFIYPWSTARPNGGIHSWYGSSESHVGVSYRRSHGDIAKSPIKPLTAMDVSIVRGWYQKKVHGRLP